MSSAAEAINKAFNWGNKEQAISDLRSSITALEENLVRKRKELMRLKSSKVSAFTEEMLDTLFDTSGVTIDVNNSTSTILINIRHGLNFLDARLQERIRNNAVFFTTPDWYSMQISLTPDRVMKVKNTTILYGDSLVHATWGSHNYTHPHAVGSSSEFSTMCTGNNPWRSNLKEALTVSDFMSAMVKASIWANSANMPDMYDEYAYKEVCPTYPLTHNEHVLIKELFQESYTLLKENGTCKHYLMAMQTKYFNTHAEDGMYWLHAILTDESDLWRSIYLRLYAAWLYIHRDRLSNSRKSLRNALLTTIFYHSEIDLTNNTYWLEAPNAFYDLVDDKFGLDFLRN